MKKILLIVAVAGLAMASCKKDRTCTCTITPTTGTTTTETTKLYKVKKKYAADWCYGHQTTTVYSGVTATGDNYTCDLK